jgi:hypothetical protein
MAILFCNGQTTGELNWWFTSIILAAQKAEIRMVV